MSAGIGSARKASGGRPRDASKDVVLLDAALVVLADVGFERMTMDLVASHAQASKATVYRRWPSKVHLVVDAVTRLGEQEVDLGALPDTGTLRGDLVGLIRPEVLEDDHRQLKLMAAVASMHVSAAEPELTRAASRASTRPWVTANRVLLQRAVERGEVTASMDLEMTARLLPAMCLFRSAIELEPLTPQYITDVIDRFLLPSLGVTAA